MGEIDRGKPEQEKSDQPAEHEQIKEPQPETPWETVKAPPNEPEVESDGGLGLFEKFANFFRQKEPEQQEVQLPEWAIGNNLEPVNEIGPQLGFTGLDNKEAGGTIAEIRQEDGPQLDLLIDIGTPLIARITRKSLNDLKLTTGSKVYALIKTVAIDRKALGTSRSEEDGY